jgi:hypothetical protein
MSLYKPETDHSTQPQGAATMRDFFEWARRICEQDDVSEIRLETPNFALSWKLPAAEDKAGS